MGGFIMFENLELIAKSISYHVKFELFKKLRKNKYEHRAIIMCVNGHIYETKFEEGMKILYPIDADSDPLCIYFQNNLNESIALHNSKLLPKALQEGVNSKSFNHMIIKCNQF